MNALITMRAFFLMEREFSKGRSLSFSATHARKDLLASVAFMFKFVAIFFKLLDSTARPDRLKVITFRLL
jgi:hypothetical protein